MGRKIDQYRGKEPTFSACACGSLYSHVPKPAVLAEFSVFVHFSPSRRIRRNTSLKVPGVARETLQALGACHLREMAYTPDRTTPPTNKATATNTAQKRTRFAR